MQLQDLIRTAVERPLSAPESEAAFREVIQGNASPVQISALLIAIRVRGATPGEVAGGVRALRSAMVAVSVDDSDAVVDTCGTGGGTLTTFNISTAAALVASSLGVRIAKHGNRSFTSRCGSADVFEALGVRFDLSLERQADVLRTAGMIFMFAPNHHPAMRHVGPVRRELGVPTIMNILGPLTNPAGAKRQVIGVADPNLLPLIAEALRELGHVRALVVHGQPGLDELSPLGPTRILDLREGEIREWTFDPTAELGWPTFAAEDLAGGDPAANAAIIESILKGRRSGAAAAAVALNAAAALYVAGKVENLTEGVRLAEEAIRAGSGWTQLERVRDETQGA
jgi:anthranilate phosphoribosyltransferase